MAAPTVTQVTLSETEDVLIRKINIATGGDTDLTATNIGDVSTFSVGGVKTRLGIRKIWWALDGFSAVVNWDATTDVPAVNLVQHGSLDVSNLARGIVNTEASGVTGDVFLATNGVGTADSGTIIIEYSKYNV